MQQPVTTEVKAKINKMYLSKTCNNEHSVNYRPRPTCQCHLLPFITLKISVTSTHVHQLKFLDIIDYLVVCAAEVHTV